MRERTRQAQRLAAEWPLLAQTLGLGYRDQWTRQHRFPTAEFVADDQGVTATVAAIAGAGLTDYQRAATYLADTWGCVIARAEQQGPGLIRLRGLHRHPLLAPAPIDLPGTAPASLTSWWLGWAEDGTAVFVRLAEVSGSVVGGWPASARPCSSPTCSVSSSPPRHPVRAHRRQGRPRLRPPIPEGVAVSQGRPQWRPRCAPAGPSPHGRPPGRHRPGAGVTDAWHLGSSPSWPLVVVVIDEAHTFFHERKGTSPEVKAHNAVVAELSRLVEELIRKGRNVAIQVMLLTQRATGMRSRRGSGTTARSPSASPPAPWMGPWPRWGRRSASIPASPRCC